METELSALGRALAETKALRFVVDVEFFENTNQPTSSFRRTIEVSRLGWDILYRQAGLIMLANRDRTIVVDLFRQEIHYQRGRRNDGKQLSTLEPEQLGESLRKLCAQGVEFRLVREEHGERHIEASSPQGEISRTDLFLNEGTHLPVRVGYLYRAIGSSPEARAEIRYQWLDASSLSTADFSEDAYVRDVDGRMEPGDSYRSFKVIGPDYVD